MSTSKGVLVGCSVLSVAAFLVMAVVAVLLDETGWFLATPIPVQNDHPSDFLHLSGTIPNGFSVQIVTQYVTTNPRYQVSVNWLEEFGTYRPRVANVDTPVQQKSGMYDTTIPLDRFQPGNPRWSPDCVYVLLRASGQHPIQIDPAVDSGETIAQVGTLICFNPPKQLPLNVHPYTYGSDWTSLTTACRLYKDTEGEPSATTQAGPGSVAYFPLRSTERHLRADFVPWDMTPNTP
jgi:hypothetical protein